MEVSRPELEKNKICKNICAVGFEHLSGGRLRRQKTFLAHFWFMWGWLFVQPEAKMRGCETIWRVLAEAGDKSWSKCHHLISYLACTPDVRWLTLTNPGGELKWFVTNTSKSSQKLLTSSVFKLNCKYFFKVFSFAIRSTLGVQPISSLMITDRQT